MLFSACFIFFLIIYTKKRGGKKLPQIIPLLTYVKVAQLRCIKNVKKHLRKNFNHIFDYIVYNSSLTNLKILFIMYISENGIIPYITKIF